MQVNPFISFGFRKKPKANTDANPTKWSVIKCYQLGGPNLLDPMG